MSHELSDHVFNTAETISRGTIAPETLLYLDAQVPSAQERIAEAWDYIDGHATEAFAEVGPVPFGDAMPISFQESGYIEHTLRLYAQQASQGSMPFRLLGYLNWPDTVDRQAATAVRHQLDRFIKDNPSTPFAYFEGQETSPIIIGGIRKKAADVLLPFLAPNAVMASRDADTDNLSPKHFQTLVQAHRSQPKGTYAAAAPRVVHTRLPHLPHIDSMIQWIEDTELCSISGRYFEPGPVLSADDYVKAGGYGATTTMAETHWLIRDIAIIGPARSEEIQLVNAATLTLSPRRIVQKLGQGERFSEIWTSSNLTAEDDYRTQLAAELSPHGDITEEARDSQLRELGSQMLRLTADKLHMLGVRYPLDEARNRLETVRQRLGGPEDMFTLPGRR